MEVWNAVDFYPCQAAYIFVFYRTSKLRLMSFVIDNQEWDTPEIGFDRVKGLRELVEEKEESCSGNQERRLVGME